MVNFSALNSMLLVLLLMSPGGLLGADTQPSCAGKGEPGQEGGSCNTPTEEDVVDLLQTHASVSHHTGNKEAKTDGQQKAVDCISDPICLAKITELLQTNASIAHTAKMEAEDEAGSQDEDEEDASDRFRASAQYEADDEAESEDVQEEDRLQEKRAATSDNPSVTDPSGSTKLDEGLVFALYATDAPTKMATNEAGKKVMQDRMGFNVNIPETATYVEDGDSSGHFHLTGQSINISLATNPNAMPSVTYVLRMRLPEALQKQNKGYVLGSFPGGYGTSRGLLINDGRFGKGKVGQQPGSYDYGFDKFPVNEWHVLTGRYSGTWKEGTAKGKKKDSQCQVHLDDAESIERTCSLKGFLNKDEILILGGYPNGANSHKWDKKRNPPQLDVSHVIVYNRILTKAEIASVVHVLNSNQDLSTAVSEGKTLTDDLYIGCYEDDNTNRDLPMYMSLQTSPLQCAKLCKNYSYFGLQNYGECRCGNSYGSDPAVHKKVNDGKCGISADQDGKVGQTNDLLGRKLKNAVFRTGLLSPKNPPAVTTKAPGTSEDPLDDIDQGEWKDGVRVANLLGPYGCSGSTSSLAQAQTRCAGKGDSCEWLHDWNCDGRDWRLCGTISEQLTGKEAVGDQFACTKYKPGAKDNNPKEDVCYMSGKYCQLPYDELQELLIPYPPGCTGPTCWLTGPKVRRSMSKNCKAVSEDVAEAQAACAADSFCEFIFQKKCTGKWYKCKTIKEYIAPDYHSKWDITQEAQGKAQVPNSCTLLQPGAGKRHFIANSCQKTGPYCKKIRPKPSEWNYKPLVWHAGIRSSFPIQECQGILSDEWKELPHNAKNAMAAQKKIYCIQVFGVLIAGSQDADQAAMRYSANIIAQLLDVDCDGKPDNNVVLDALNMWKLNDDGHAEAAWINHGVSAEDEMVHPMHDLGGSVGSQIWKAAHFYVDPNVEIDRNSLKPGIALEEAFHMIHQKGWAKAYPEVFGYELWGSAQQSTACECMREAQCNWYQHPENGGCLDKQGVMCQNPNFFDWYFPSGTLPGTCGQGTCSEPDCDCVEFVHKVYTAWLGNMFVGYERMGMAIEEKKNGGLTQREAIEALLLETPYCQQFLKNLKDPELKVPKHHITETYQCL